MTFRKTGSLRILVHGAASRTLARVACQIWLFGFIAFFGAESIHLDPTLRITAQVLYGAPVVGWGIWCLSRERLDQLDLAVGALLVVYLGVCLTSADRTGSLETLALATAFALLFIGARRISPHWRETVAIGVATVMSLSLVYNAYLLLAEKVRWVIGVGTLPQLEGLEVFPWQSVNAMPVVVLVALPFLGWTPNALRRIAVLIVALAAVIVVPFSAGRAGMIGLATAGTVVAGTSATLRERTHLVLTRRIPGRLAVVIGGLLAIVVLVVGGRLLVSGLYDSGRLALWEQAARMIAATPLDGSGPSTYSWARLQYGPEQARLLAIPLAHNVVIQTLVDGGLVLLIGAVAVLAIAVRSITWGARTGWGERLAFAALAGFAATEMLDEFSYVPSITALVIVALAWIVTPAMRERSTRARGVAAAVGFALLLAISLPAVVSVDAARGSALRGRSSAVAGDWDAAVTAFSSATESHPMNGGYWLALGQAFAYAGDADSALAAYAMATHVSPGDPRGYGGVAALSTGGERVAVLRTAADLSTGDPQYAVRLGIALAATDRNGAAQAWGRAVALGPGLIRELPFATFGISREAVYDYALAHVEAYPHPDAYTNETVIWDIGLVKGNLPEGTGAAWRAVQAATRGQLDVAARLAEVAVREAPYVASSYEAMAAVAAFRCDTTAAADWLGRAGFTRDAYARPASNVTIRREFVYREVGLGSTQPPHANPVAPPAEWPWSLVDRPAC